MSLHIISNADTILNFHNCALVQCVSVPSVHVCGKGLDLNSLKTSADTLPLFSIIYHFIDLSIKTVKPAVHELYCFPPFISLPFGTSKAVSLPTEN